MDVKSIVFIIGSCVTIISVISTIIWRLRVEINGKLKRYWQRLDENKEKVEQGYTTKELCDFKYGSVAEDISSIKVNIKSIETLLMGKILNDKN